MAKKAARRRMPLVPLHNDWSLRASLLELAELLQDRVTKWHYPPAADMDDSLPAFAEARGQRHWFSFERPIETDLGSVQFDRARVALRASHPSLATRLEKKVNALASRIPLRPEVTPEAIMVELAQTAEYLLLVADQLPPPDRPHVATGDPSEVLTTLHQPSEVEQSQPLATDAVTSESSIELGSKGDTLRRLMNLFANGVVDERLNRALKVLQSDLPASEKLDAIDEAMPIPANASASRLGVVLGISKQAVLKTDWWHRKRRGEKASEIGRRYEALRRKSLGQIDGPDPSEDDEP